MSLKICDYLFYGPFKVAETIVRANHVPVVYAIIAKEGKPWDPVFRLIDVGYSPASGLVFSEHPDHARWGTLSTGTLGVYLLDVAGDTPDASHRRTIADTIRTRLDPPNGLIQIHAI